MNPPKFKDRLILVLLAMLHEHAPGKLDTALERLGFRPGDVVFRRTKNRKRARTWTTIRRWPWDPA